MTEPRSERSTLVHIIGRDEWEAVLHAGSDYHQPGFEDIGFTHLSTPELVLHAARRFYAGRSDLVLLVLDPDRVEHDVVWEAGVAPDAHLQFPHLYGPLPLDAVDDVVPLRLGDDGEFVMPERFDSDQGPAGPDGR